jgi:hypothetical protein
MSSSGDRNNLIYWVYGSEFRDVIVTFFLVWSIRGCEQFISRPNCGSILRQIVLILLSEMFLSWCGA